MTSTGLFTTAPSATGTQPVKRVALLGAALAAGGLFGFGLALSTMIQPAIVLGFLTLNDAGLMLVMGGGVLVSLVTYQLAPRVMRRPLFGGTFARRAAVFDRSTLLGAALFGIGWGMCGVCPGPAIAGLGAGSFELGWALAGISLGALLQGLTSKR